jgi:hypothetical protein
MYQLLLKWSIVTKEIRIYEVSHRVVAAIRTIQYMV